MVTRIELGGIVLEVVKKDIKNLHLSVYPPSGKVRIAAPLRMNADTIRVYAISKLDWIKQQQKKLREQERETPREYLDRETHYVWGKRYLLNVIEENAATRVELGHRKLILRARPETSTQFREAIVAQWYREQIKGAVPELIAKWELVLGVRLERFYVQRMKTKWGSCNPRAQTIRLNTELAKKPKDCLEYIIVHELAHLLEPRHNERFITLMDKFLPHWEQIKKLLNAAPLGHESWSY